MMKAINKGTILTGADPPGWGEFKKSLERQWDQAGKPKGEVSQEKEKNRKKEEP